MPIGPAAKTNQRGFVPAVEIRARLAEVFELTPIVRAHGETAHHLHHTAGDDDIHGLSIDLGLDIVDVKFHLGVLALLQGQVRDCR